MKKLFFLPLLFAYVGHTYPLMFQATTLTHEKKNKTILLLGELHKKVSILHMKNIGCKNETIEDFERIEQIQLGILDDFIKNLLNARHKKTCIITETYLSKVTSVANQEAGFTPKLAEDETVLGCIPHLLLGYLMKDGNTPDEKMHTVENSFLASKGKYRARFPSFVINQNVVWIPGDTLRTSQEDRLCNDIYEHSSHIIEALKKEKTGLHKEVTELTIGFVKEHISSWQKILSNHSFNDLYGTSLAAMLNDAISKSCLSDTDHFILLHRYLLNNNLKAEASGLRNKILYFIAQKQDLELQFHADAITESGDECDQAVVVAGATHTQLLRDYLLTKGYTITHQSGIDYDDSKDKESSFNEQIVEQAALLSNNFTTIAQSVLV